MDEVTIFGLDYFKANYPERLQERFKGMDLEQETPDLSWTGPRNWASVMIMTVFTTSLSRTFEMGVWEPIH